MNVEMPKFFKVTLADANVPVPTTGVIWDLAPIRILLVEDNSVNLKFGKVLLRMQGHEVVKTAKNGRECISALELEDFDLVLMDANMPIMNGEEALREIRSKEQGTSIHHMVIALTAHALVGDKERYLSMGFDGYLSKPIEKNELVSEMKRVLRLHALHGAKSEIVNEHKPPILFVIDEQKLEKPDCALYHS